MNLNTSINLLKSFIKAPQNVNLHSTLKMNGVILTSYGESLNNLEYRHGLNVYTPERSQVLIKVHASSLNALDNDMRKGYAKNIISLKNNNYYNNSSSGSSSTSNTTTNRRNRESKVDPIDNNNNDGEELSLILGRDCCGEIIQVGRDVWDYKVGDLVWGATAPFSSGTHCDYVLMDESDIALKPTTLSHLDAASVPYAALTAWTAIFNYAKLSQDVCQANRLKILVNGASGGVGFHIVNILKKHLGCNWVAASCNQKHFKKLINAGADQVIDYHLDHFNLIQNQSNNQNNNNNDEENNNQNNQNNGKRIVMEEGFDIVFNCVKGGQEIERKCISALKQNGHYIDFNGPIVNQIDNDGLFIGISKSVWDRSGGASSLSPNNNTLNNISGTISNTVFKYGKTIKYDHCIFNPSGKTLRTLSKLYDSKLLDLNIGSVLNLSNIRDAYQLYENGGANGKIVLSN